MSFCNAGTTRRHLPLCSPLRPAVRIENRVEVVHGHRPRHVYILLLLLLCIRVHALISARGERLICIPLRYMISTEYLKFLTQKFNMFSKRRNPCEILVRYLKRISLFPSRQ